MTNNCDGSGVRQVFSTPTTPTGLDACPGCDGCQYPERAEEVRQHDPDCDFCRMLRGEITSAEYAKRLKAEVRRKRLLSDPEEESDAGAD